MKEKKSRERERRGREGGRENNNSFRWGAEGRCRYHETK